MLNFISGFETGVRVNREDLIGIVESTGLGIEPEIRLLKRANGPRKRLGLFSSSFNPVTNAHLKIIRAAAETFDLDEVLALAGKANADKRGYECSLAARIEMLLAAVADLADVSVGLSSSAFFVDKVDALARAYPGETEMCFIIGFDTFERILDKEDRYTGRYHRRFRGREEALRYLLSRSRLIVASRSGKGSEKIRNLAALEAGMQSERILCLELPPDLGDRSASEVRARISAGLAVTGLVPPEAERYIDEHGLYKGDR